MWCSESIVSLKISKGILEYICISPFHGINRLQVVYYIKLLLVYELVFSSSFYLTFFHSGEAHVHLEKYDAFYVVEQIARFMMGRIFSLGVMYSLCSRSAQLQLQKRIASLDYQLTSQLRVYPSFHRINIHFIVCCVVIAIYHYSDYLLYRIFDVQHIPSVVYYFCCMSATVYFHFYGIYTVYWARAYLDRSEHITTALRDATSQRFISKKALTAIMESIKLLFDVRESIQDAFGSMLCIIVMVNSFHTAQSMFAFIHKYEREAEHFYLWFDYLIWSVTLWSELAYVTIYFTKIGDNVSS